MLTPREVGRLIAGREAAEREAMAATISGAWHAAAFQRTKKLPKLKPLIEKMLRGPRREQTPAESLKVAEQLNALFGGRDLRHLRKS